MHDVLPVMHAQVAVTHDQFPITHARLLVMRYPSSVMHPQLSVMHDQPEVMYDQSGVMYDLLLVMHDESSGMCYPDAVREGQPPRHAEFEDFIMRTRCAMRSAVLGLWPSQFLASLASPAAMAFGDAVVAGHALWRRRQVIRIAVDLLVSVARRLPRPARRGGGRVIGRRVDFTLLCVADAHMFLL